eukprot:m.82153 g.82153  ORF g.82153 m.82153 type:complete len:530 (+) comp14603_c0_seq1:123-1712(+)
MPALPGRRRWRLWLTVAFVGLLTINAGLYMLRCQRSSSDSLLFCSFTKPQGSVNSGKAPLVANTAQPSQSSAKVLDTSQRKEAIAVVIGEFEEWSHQLERTCKTWLQLPSVAKVVLLAERHIYPPLKFLSQSPQIQVVVISQLEVAAPASNQSLGSALEDVTAVMVAPDGILLDASAVKHTDAISHMLARLGKTTIGVTPVEATECQRAEFNVREWTLTIGAADSDSHCSWVQGPAVIVMTTATALDLHLNRYRLLQHGILLEAAAKQLEVVRLAFPPIAALAISELFPTPHLQDKHRRLQASRQQQLFRTVGVKQVLDNNKSPVLLGCTRNTARCFGTVVHDRPEYLAQGRWTPPCCLEHIRETFRYVIATLEAAKVRYWLEGGTLLGALRNADIIKWDYDADLGLWLDDLELCWQLKQAKLKGAVEDRGFVWEKAREGDFYRVQYSRANRVHVDLFPFYEKDGMMTKDTWMETHQQDMAFPAHYVKHFERIPFVGTMANAPSDARGFAELKFGKGAIEHPRLPGPTA